MLITIATPKDKLQSCIVAHCLKGNSSNNSLIDGSYVYIEQFMALTRLLSNPFCLKMVSLELHETETSLKTFHLGSCNHQMFALFFCSVISRYESVDRL